MNYIGIRDISATPPCLDLITLISIRAWISYSPELCKWKARVTVVAWWNGATPYSRVQTNPCLRSLPCLCYMHYLVHSIRVESRTRSCQTRDSTEICPLSVGQQEVPSLSTDLQTYT